MAEKSVAASHPLRFGVGTVGLWLAGLLCFGILGFFILQLGIQFASPSSVHRLQLVTDIILPGVEVPPKGQPQLQSIRFDHFDFQALDPQTGLLFIAHPGPSDVKLDLLLSLKQLPPGTTFKGSVVVVDTKQNKYIGSISLPTVHGLAVVPELGRVYAAGANDDKIFVIDEQTLKVTAQIPVGSKTCTTPPCSMPDALAYDPDDHKLFISEPGIDKDHQGVGVIDVQTNHFVAQIPLNVDQFGDDIGHSHYDPVSRRVYVVMQPLPNPNDPNAMPMPPSYLAAIDPLTDRFITRGMLPNTCHNPHGQTIDSQQHVAFVACINSQNIVAMDIRTMQPIGTAQPVGFKPDIVALDNNLHVLFVGCQSAISVFNEQSASTGVLKKLKDYIISTSSAHSIAIDDTRHIIYVPLTNVGGRPMLRIEQFNPNGNV